MKRALLVSCLRSPVSQSKYYTTIKALFYLPTVTFTLAYYYTSLKSEFRRNTESREEFVIIRSLVWIIHRFDERGNSKLWNDFHEIHENSPRVLFLCSKCRICRTHSLLAVKLVVSRHLKSVILRRCTGGFSIMCYSGGNELERDSDIHLKATAWVLGSLNECYLAT